MDKQIAILLEASRRATNKLYDGIKFKYKPGTKIIWGRGDYPQEGTVLETSLDRIKVKNDKTGADYWIYISDIK